MLTSCTVKHYQVFSTLGTIPTWQQSNIRL